MYSSTQIHAKKQHIILTHGISRNEVLKARAVDFRRA
jgi:hypothetical protein